MFYKTEKLGVFIDGGSFFHQARAIDMQVDYIKMRRMFMNRGQLGKMNYYTVERYDEQDNSPVRRLLDFLDYNGYRVITREQREYEVNGVMRYKGTIDVELAIDLLQASNHLEHIVLISGNGELAPAVQAAQKNGARITVVGALKSPQGSLVADELRRAADNFVELESLREDLEKEPFKVAAE